MTDEIKPPSLPNYSAHKGVALPSHPKQQAPLLKLMGKMMAAKLPKMMGKISPQTVKMKHSKKEKKQAYYW